MKTTALLSKYGIVSPDSYKNLCRTFILPKVEYGSNITPWAVMSGIKGMIRKITRSQRLISRLAFKSS